MKKKVKDPAPREGKKPFFARLLEEQELDEAAGGGIIATKKFPSDTDECHAPPIHTLKFPSDNDETPTY